MIPTLLEDIGRDIEDAPAHPRWIVAAPSPCNLFDRHDLNAEKVGPNSSDAGGRVDKPDNQSEIIEPLVNWELASIPAHGTCSTMNRRNEVEAAAGPGAS